ncbi:MAG: PEP-CTERM sorting domain-containing protein [Nitrospiraceae bacterium]|nr:PEP-CTERM sorting domain-containing protein [Nitrospiraceae bacterium]
MKKIRNFFWVVILYAILVPTLAYGIPTVDIDLLNPTINVGDSFVINVTAHGVTDFDPLFGFYDEFLSFNFNVVTPSEFVFNGATVNPSFNDDSALFPDVAGHVFPGITGDNIFLASLDFSALTGGDFSLGISSDISVGQGLFTLFYGPLDITTSIPLTVNTPVPEPSTILLVSAGLIGLAGIRKKIRKS